MTIQYYVGNKELSFAEFEKIKKEQLELGHGIAGTKEVDGYPEYTLDNGTVIRGNKLGEFNRMQGGEVMEEWLAGTENEWSQGEPMHEGKADFFCKA